MMNVFFLEKRNIFHGMKYREYLDTAKRHLTTCRKFFDSINWSDYPQEDDLSREEKKLSTEEKKLNEKKECLYNKKNELLKENKKNLPEEKIQQLEIKKRQLEKDELLLLEQFSQLKEKEAWRRRKQNLLKEKDCRLRDIYYLAGYIFESFIVFKIYEVGYRHVKDVYRECGKKFNPDDHDIDEFIKEFTRVDYFPRFVDKNGQVTLKRKRTKIHDGRKLKPDEEEFLKNVEGLCAIEQHKFQELFKMIQRNKGLRDAMFPSSVNIPLFLVNASSEIEKIINRWTSKLRYSDPDVWDKSLKDLVNESTLKEILDICQQMNEKIAQF